MTLKLIAFSYSVSRSAASFAWTSILGKVYNEEISRVLQAIMPALDLADYAFTPLHSAVLGLAPSTVGEVLRHHPLLAVDVQDSSGRTALWWAVRRGDYHATELLLRNYADPGKSESHGFYTTTSAIKAGSGRCLQLLLNYGVNIHRRNISGLTSLMTLALYSNDIDMLEMLLQHNPNLNARGPDGDSAMLIAIEYQHHDVAKRLIEVGADIHIKENAGFNALSVAILFNVHLLIQTLLDRQADHHGPIKQYGTLLHLVAQVADAESLRLLTQGTLATRDVHVKRGDGQTAVDVARARINMTLDWQNAFYAFLWSVDKTKIRVSPFSAYPHTNHGQFRAEDSDGEEVFYDALE